MVKKEEVKQRMVKQKKGDAWVLVDILKNETYDSIIVKIEQNTKKIENYRKTLKSIKSNELFKLINLIEETEMLFSRLSGYYSLKTSENTKDEDALAKLSALSMKGADFESRTLFFQLWFIGLDDVSAAKFIQSKELQRYKYFLEGMRLFKPYTKSEEVEQILTIKDITGGNAFSSLYDIHVSSYKFDFDGKKDLTQDEISAYFMDNSIELRQKAYDLVYSKYKEDSVFLSELYKNVVLDWANEAVKIRGYKTSISPRNLGNRVDDESIKSFIAVVRKNTNLFVEYFKLKNEILNKQIKNDARNKNNMQGKNNKNFCAYSRYHIYAPIKTKEKNYSYEESKKIVLDTFKRLDERFYVAAKKLFDEKHIHSHPVSGKRGGAFCSTISNNITPYVLLNHSDKLNDVFTMMHELGHAIHSQFSAKQTDLLSHAKLPLAETASIFSEILLLHRFLDESKDADEKLSLLIHSMDSHYRSIPRQAYFVIFEQWAHDNIKEGVTKKEIDAYYRSLLKEQFGEMEIPEIFDHEWNYIPHIHHTPFYCYAYSWGHLLSLAFYAMYKEQGKKFVDKYIEFLSAGASKSTTDIMLAMGADPKSEAFWQKGFNIIKTEIEELKILLEKGFM